MENIIDYIKEAKLKLNIKSDRKLAVQLNISNVALVYILKGRSHPSDETCLKLAQLTGDDPEKILLLANKSRASEQSKPYWDSILKKIASYACLLLGIRYIM